MTPTKVKPGTFGNPPSPHRKPGGNGHSGDQWGGAGSPKRSPVNVTPCRSDNKFCVTTHV